jgi:dCMP deaminase
MERLDKDTYYLKVARVILERGTCIRRNYGAVIVNNDQIVGTGYTGAPRGEDNCCDTGICERERLQIKSGERYELCKSVHAEMNAIMSAGRDKTIGATIYVVGKDMKTEGTISTYPCPLCSRMIKNACIARVVIPIDNQQLLDIRP